MLVQPVSLQVDLRPEDHELLLLAVRLLAQVVVRGEVAPQVVVLGVEVLQAVRVTEVAEVVVFPQMLVQFLVVYEPLVTELAEGVALETGVVRVSLPPGQIAAQPQPQPQPQPASPMSFDSLELALNSEHLELLSQINSDFT